MTPHTAAVLKALMGRRDGDDAERRQNVLLTGLYGVALAEATKLPNGTLFPLLERLLQAGWVERYWEQDELAEAQGRPRRRYYRISSKGAELAPAAIAAQSTTSKSTARGLKPQTAGGV